MLCCRGALMSSLSHVLHEFVQNALSEINTSFFAKVVRYDHETLSADLQPCHKIKRGEKLLELPLLNNVPILFGGSNDCLLAFPLRENDLVMVIIPSASNSALNEKESSNFANDSNSRFNLSDAVAIPIFSQSSKNISPKKDALTIIYKKSCIEISESGQIVINSENSIEIKSDSNLNINCKSASINSDNVKLSGNLECENITCKSLESSSTIKAQNEVIAGIAKLSLHTHPVPIPPGGVSGPPSP